MPEQVPDENVPNRRLPQPSTVGAQPYRYVKFEQIGTEFFGDFPAEAAKLSPDTLCWVLLSKGKNKTPQLYERARADPVSQDEPDRMTVRYPSGKTYRVRKRNLMPVLEHQSHLILVASETNDYRRIATVHTTKEDNFMEIGCDFGILVDSVDAKTRLGVDKSEESIRTARERYPHRDFLLGDVFGDDLGIDLESPSVIAIDINGNRMLPAVLDCIQLAVDRWSPRLIVVKSRELYARLDETHSTTVGDT
jgi:hypothetical protein